MIKNKFGEIIYQENDLVDFIMQGNELPADMILSDPISVDNTVVDTFVRFRLPTDETISLELYDQNLQSNWYMPDEYKNLDIAEYILTLCNTDEQLQRVGHELLLYQEKNLFNLLRYLKYLVDTMKQHKIIWGVGRGSSVASYILYLLGVHKIDSMYYDLDPEEFLR